MRLNPKKTLRKSLLAVAYLAFACKVLIPVGYMPAAVAGGAWLTLCSSSLPPHLLEEAGGHDHDHGDESGDQSAELPWKHCPLGALTGSAPLASASPAIPFFGATVAPSVSDSAIAYRAAPAAFRSRAPPASLA